MVHCNKTHRLVLLFAIASISVLCGAVRAAEVIYVNADAAGANTGLNWTDAYTDLQDALDEADALNTAGIEIWVAAGTYVPGRGEGTASSSFELISGVGLYGGFAGTESLRHQRDPARHPTVLSGDIYGNDGPDFENIAGNCLNVVRIIDGDSATVLDGFVITGGNSYFSIEGGKSSGWGGGLYVEGGSPTIRRCTFLRNSADDFGGAVFIWEDSSAKLVDCVFVENRAAVGGATSVSESTPVLANCVYLGNTTHTSWHGFSHGGAAYLASSCATVVNCVINGNSAEFGGAVHMEGEAASTLVNCTLSHNHATTSAGGVHSSSVPGPALYNTIIWGNTEVGGSAQESQFRWDSRRSPPVLEHCCVMGWTGQLGGFGNFDGNPRFIDADGPDQVLGTMDDNLRVQAGSPCINRGSDELLPADEADLDEDGDRSEPVPLDLDRRTRVIGPMVDIGAFEFSDCNGNGVTDDQDILAGTSQDVNGDGVPDECECLRESDCDDANLCTDDACVEGECRNLTIPNCCNADSECLDADICTLDTCVNGTCRNDRIEGCCTSREDCFVDDPCVTAFCIDHWCEFGAVPDCDDAGDLPVLDEDGDGVPDARDQCPGTEPGALVNSLGCADHGSEDDDGDNIENRRDECPDTPPGVRVDRLGCPCSSSDLDDDGDGVYYCDDLCVSTPSDEGADERGCSCSQLDADYDKVDNCDDRCPGTFPLELVDESGCSCRQRDGDEDGVNDCRDLCPETPEGERVDTQGCACEQLDGDSDGVDDCRDRCPGTPDREAVDEDGCTSLQRDADLDGVPHWQDHCPNTLLGELVNYRGCAATQLDSDGDGVPDGRDKCTATSPGRATDGDGCSPEQLGDDDADGVPNYRDQCPKTPDGSLVSVIGCSCDALDDDEDGVSNCEDFCPDTSLGVPANEYGCACNQRDGDGDDVNDCYDLCPQTPIGEPVSSDGCSAADLAPAAAPAPPAMPCGAVGVVHVTVLMIGLAFLGFGPARRRR